LLDPEVGFHATAQVFRARETEAATGPRAFANAGLLGAQKA